LFRFPSVGATSEGFHLAPSIQGRIMKKKNILFSIQY
jgi:hypothetical protein